MRSVPLGIIYFIIVLAIFPRYSKTFRYTKFVSNPTGLLKAKLSKVTENRIATGTTMLQSAMTNSYNSAEFKQMIKRAVAWCGVNGLMYTDGDLTWTPAPIAMIPNTFPKSAFTYSKDLQTALNELVDKISRDREFILGQLSSVAESDEFILNLIKIYQQVPEDTLLNGLQFGILRSDYMVDEIGSAPLQIEINTIASSFGCLSQKVEKFQRAVLLRNQNSLELEHLIREVTGATEVILSLNAQSMHDSMVENESIKKLAAGIATAHTTFKKIKAVDNPSVLFIVQPGERNVADQRLLEMALWESHQIPVEFRTLYELRKTLQRSLR
jgi:hypothetical protein